MNIAVTGYGIISAIGNNADETLSSLLAKQSGVSSMRYLQSVHDDLPVGEVKLSNAQLKDMLGITPERIISRTTLLGAVAVRQALDAASYTAADLQGKRVAFISGTTVGGMDVTESLFTSMCESDEHLSYIGKHDCGSNSEEIAEICGLHDVEVSTISTACSSALNAIIVGCEMLKRDEVDIVIAGGTEALSKFHLNGFNMLMILDHEQCRPFDSTRAGLNLGEGAAYLVLEKDKEQAKAYISGYGNRCDAFHQTATSDDGEGAYLAMSDALKMAALSPDDIDYVNAHGTGTPNNDISESVALQRVFGNAMPPVSSTKSFTGHTTSASGSIETVISILAMQNGFIPANIGWKNQIEGGITPSLGCENAELNHVVCNSFGFGGNDSSIIISKNLLVNSEQKLCFNTEFTSEFIVDDIAQLSDLKEFVSPMQSRRMGKLMKAATLSSLKALQAAGVECPDAIITGTAYGMLETSEKFLKEMIDNGEESLSPTLFMQSTHNTIGSAIAIRTKCHGYNITYTQGEASLEWALRDARRLIETGKAETVLVGVHDESTPQFDDFCKRMGKEIPKQIYSRSIVIKKL
ncbi:MAG: beta-ketoacyl-[acyl-carrier-protein] synthase family protein [Prevotella sp.]|nr:beta-ketoacyl-[acyl-carrier-protein] synthase family protein [Candidatus Prevotella equi]